MGGETTTVARRGRIFTPQLDLSIAIVTENIYFPEIPRLSRLPVYIGALEIAWWCRDWIGVMCSWLTCNTNILVMVSSGENPVGAWRRFDDLFINPTADFILLSRHIGVWGGDKAVYRGKACTVR